MKYLSFIEDQKVLDYIIGSTVEDIDHVEKELGVRIPAALREYLEMMGEKPLDNEYWEQGTKDMKQMRENIYEDIEEYRSRGYPLNEIRTVIPFHKFLDTYFFVPVEDGNENPPVMALDIDAAPTVRKCTETLTEYVQLLYDYMLKELNLPKK